MKKLTIVILFTFISQFITALAQAQQMKKWYIAPNQADVTNGITPTVSALPGPAATTPTAIHVANGLYDGTANHNLLFYISDNAVYDYNNMFIGYIPVGSAEVCIVPFGDNSQMPDICRHKYNIFTLESKGSCLALYQSVLDLNSYTISTYVIEMLTGINDNIETGAIAVSKIYPNGLRHLYYCAAPGNYNTPTTPFQIRHFIIDPNGNINPAATPTLFSPPVPDAGIVLLSNELDVSPDGKHLAWASLTPNSLYPYRYYLLELDGNGNYVSGTYTPFNVGSTGNNYYGFRGVEFDATSSYLFVGAGSDGIYRVDLSNVSNAIQVAGSFFPYVYGNSQLEMANNGFIYAGSSTDVGAIDVGAVSITPGSNNLTIVAPLANLSSVNASSQPFYTLPDQLDGDDYDNITSSVPLIPFISSYATPASTTATWSYGVNPFINTLNPVYIVKELRIKDNSHITIDGMTFKFSPKAKVIIEKGSSLTLTNLAVLTSDYMGQPCTESYTWGGVEVGGDKTLNQFTAGAQGKLIMNNSTISYAECGAQNTEAGINSGGIIIASSTSSFYNNKIGIKFNKYQNYIPTPSGKKPYYPNLSSFTGCTFSADGLYPFADPPALVSFIECNGVTLSQCTFHAANSPNLVNALSIGIKSIDSRFTVMNNSSFMNLWHGIDAVRSGANQPFWVFETTFENNQTGIAAKGITGLKVQNNIFSIGGNLNTAYPVNAGISLDNCTGYIIEENQFNGSGSNVKYGIMIYNSGAAYNEIYKNTFTGLDVANVAGGINMDNSAPSIYGLQYVCNQNSGNSMFDFFIGKQVGTFPYGIREYQGMQGFAAGNTFSFTGPATTDIYNKASFVRYYYWNGSAAEEPLYFNTPAVTITSVTQQNTCSSNIGGTAQRLTLEEKDSLIDSYNIAETAYLNLLYSYNQLMDGGNTNALLNQIQQSWSQDALVLRDQLLAHSPYLTEEVLREAAGSNVLPLAMLLNVCLANPDATHNDGFLYYLQYEIPNPMPQYMIDMIIASWDANTARTVMEGMLGQFSQKMAASSNRILTDLYFYHDFENDSIIPTDTTDYNDTIRYWLTRVQTLSAKYDLIENYFAYGEYAEAENILDSIPFNFRLSEDQQQAYNNYVDFYNFRKNIVTSDSSLSNLDSNEINQLVNFADNNIGLSQALSQNILCFYYGICTDIDYNLELNGNRMQLNTSSDERPKINVINVAPNPCKTYTSFIYSFPLLKDRAILTISDITGKIVKTITLKNNEGQQIWETREVEKGIYFYSFKDGNGIIAKGKIAVQK